MATHDIHEVARDCHVIESPMKHHPWNFSGKYHYLILCHIMENMTILPYSKSSGGFQSDER